MEKLKIILPDGSTLERSPEQITQAIVAGEALQNQLAADLEEIDKMGPMSIGDYLEYQRGKRYAEVDALFLLYAEESQRLAKEDSAGLPAWEKTFKLTLAGLRAERLKPGSDKEWIDFLIAKYEAHLLLIEPLPVAAPSLHEALNYRQIALLCYYTDRPITPNNAQQLAESYRGVGGKAVARTAGQQLLEYSLNWANSIAIEGATSRQVKDLLRDIRRVKEFLNEKQQQQAQLHIQHLERKLS